MSATTGTMPDVRLVVADARLQQLRSLTPLPPGPAVLQPLAGAGSLGFALAPSGHSLGVVAAGDGPAFTDAMAGVTEGLLSPSAADHVRTIGALASHRGLVAEVVVGQAGWMWVGARGVEHDRAQAILEQAGVAVDERARLLHEAGASVSGVALFADGVHPPGLAVTHTFDQPEAMHTVTLVAGQPQLRQLRGPGASDRALIEWMVAERIATEDSVGRLGRAHSILETTGPRDRVWLASDPAGTVVFLYDSPSAQP